MTKVTKEQFYDFFFAKENITTEVNSNNDWLVRHNGRLIAKSVEVDQFECEYFIINK